MTVDLTNTTAVIDPAALSMAQRLDLIPEAERDAWLASLTDAEAYGLEHSWDFWGRPDQHLPGGAWTFWLVMAGRGWGKTRTGAEAVNAKAEALGDGGRIALVARTAGDVRDTMVEGESGILACVQPDNRPNYEPSKRRVTWPNGCVGVCFSSEKPDALRGPQSHFAWCDELAAWKYLTETWDNLMLGLRLGLNPQVVITTTPKPVKVLRDLLKDEETIATRGTTYENLNNLSGRFRKTVLSRYEGTRLGRQELMAELLDQAEGALWAREWILPVRMTEELRKTIRRIVVAIDPSASKGGDEAGVVVAGITGGDRDKCRGIILEDISGRMTPAGWAREAVSAYDRWQADLIIGEGNNGGEMVEHTIRTVSRNVSYKMLWASKSKQARAEPVAAFYEQGRIDHIMAKNEQGVEVSLVALEDEYCGWEPNTGAPSPNRLDAAVWGLTELMVQPAEIRGQKITGV
jgi:phage terminase large subunit-like protein